MKQNDTFSASARRAELQEKIQTFGAAALTDEENLEFLLLHASKRDTSQAAKKLLMEFNSLRGVMEASVGALTAVEGVLPQEAQFLYLVSQSQRVTKDPRRNQKNIVLKTPQEWLNFFKKLYVNEPLELVRVAFLNRHYTLLRVVNVGRGAPLSVTPNTRFISEACLQDPSNTYAIFSHNHPHCDPLPSEQDLDYTQRVKYIFRDAGVTLLDHVIVGAEDTGYSFRLSGDISWKIEDDEQ